MKQPHLTQMPILRDLLFVESMTFSEMGRKQDIENNELDFHLKQTVKRGWVKKDENSYKLTAKGKEYENMMDTERKKMIKQAKLGALSCCMRDINGENEFLLYTRLKQPFYGGQGWPSGKIEFGETTLEGAKRELKEETSLDGEPILVAIEHYIVKEKETGEVVEDKLLFLHKFIEPKGELTFSDEGEYHWIKESEISEYVKKPFDSMDSLLKEIEMVKDFNGEVKFIEIIQEVTEF